MLVGAELEVRPEKPRERERERERALEEAAMQKSFAVTCDKVTTYNDYH